MGVRAMARVRVKVRPVVRACAHAAPIADDHYY